MKEFLTGLIIFILYLALQEPTTNTIFSDIQDQDLILPYYVEVDNLNTSNFNEYFSDLNVLAIIPYINPIYKDKVDLLYMYKNLDNFKSYYIKKLKEKGYYIEANKYLIGHIKIDKVLVYSSLNNLYDKFMSVSKKYSFILSDGYVNLPN